MTAVVERYSGRGGGDGVGGEERNIQRETDRQVDGTSITI